MSGKIEIVGTETGRCCFCVKGKEKPLFVIRAPNIDGGFCHEHLYMLASQMNTKDQKENEASLFDGARK